jgi:ectoine hydroxylase-related dioxygenase (phytanoyl-CoA dioxygenase family)
MSHPAESYHKFILNGEPTQEQIASFDLNGFVHYKKFLDDFTIKSIIDALYTLQQKWIAENVKEVNGIPIRYGFDENNQPIIHRFAFTSLHSEAVHKLVNHPSIQALRKLLQEEDARLGENEKDGVVVNQYFNTSNSKMKQMGWHTDSLRDIFYGRRVKPMLNIGINLTDSKKMHGGLRVLKGTHKQSLYQMIFRKPYYVNNEQDENEVAIETEAGDVTVHHGHIWHRVATSEMRGMESRRITMYIPIVCGKYAPKDEHSFTPIYHRMNIFAKK